MLSHVTGLCIDQTNITQQLPSLPVYLAGCKTVLALQGRSYFERLWCILELHIFHQMGGSLDQIVFIPLDDCENDVQVRGNSFDVRHAHASQVNDQERLLAVIEGSGEGIGAFNLWVRNTLLPAAKYSSPRRQAPIQSCGQLPAGFEAVGMSRESA